MVGINIVLVPPCLQYMTAALSMYRVLLVLENGFSFVVMVEREFHAFLEMAMIDSVLAGKVLC